MYSDTMTSLRVDVEEAKHHLPVGGALRRGVFTVFAEHRIGRGGAMVQADLLDHFTGDIIDNTNVQ